LHNFRGRRLFGQGKYLQDEIARGRAIDRNEVNLKKRAMAGERLAGHRKQRAPPTFQNACETHVASWHN
jgi:hypothetical protein